MAITIYHNPACGTSRTVLQALKDGGHAPQVVEYLKAGWTRRSWPTSSSGWA